MLIQVTESTRFILEVNLMSQSDFSVKVKGHTTKEADRWKKTRHMSKPHNTFNDFTGRYWHTSSVIGKSKRHRYIQKNIYNVTYWKYAYDLQLNNVHIRLTAVWKEIVLVSPFVSLALTFKNIVSQPRNRNEI